MNKELIDRAWSILPKEFKEGVKKDYKICSEGCRVVSAGAEKWELRGCYRELEELFGHHNLTSDAEEEDEMLYVSRKQIDALQGEIFKAIMDAHDADDWQDAAHYILDVMPRSFAALFGSKYLPDEDAHEDNFATKKPQPAEPKFNLGDKAILKGYVCTITSRVYEQGKFVGYKIESPLLHGNATVPESYLEPYTEQREDLIPPNSGELESQEADKQFNTIIKDSFAKERRLNIAAQIVASMVGSDDWTTWRGGTNKEIWHNMAKSSLEIADALIAECEKKGGQDA